MRSAVFVALRGPHYYPLLPMGGWLKPNAEAAPEELQRFLNSEWQDIPTGVVNSANKYTWDEAPINAGHEKPMVVLNRLLKQRYGYFLGQVRGAGNCPLFAAFLAVVAEQMSRGQSRALEDFNNAPRVTDDAVTNWKRWLFSQMNKRVGAMDLRLAGDRAEGRPHERSRYTFTELSDWRPDARNETIKAALAQRDVASGLIHGNFWAELLCALYPHVAIVVLGDRALAAMADSDGELAMGEAAFQDRGPEGKSDVVPMAFLTRVSDAGLPTAAGGDPGDGGEKGAGARRAEALADLLRETGTSEGSVVEISEGLPEGVSIKDAKDAWERLRGRPSPREAMKSYYSMRSSLGMSHVNAIPRD